MSVVVASHYIRNLNTGKKEVQFLSNVEVPLPPIPLSKIEKEFFLDVHVPKEHSQVARKQLYKEAWQTAAKLQLSATKELNARHRLGQLEQEFESKRSAKTIKLESRAKRLQESMQKQKEASLSKHKIFKERREQIMQKNQQEKDASLNEYSKLLRTRMLSTAEHSPMKISSPATLLISRRKTTADMPLTTGKPQIRINVEPSYITQHRRVSSDIKHNNSNHHSKPHGARVSSTQSSQSIRDRMSNAWDTRFNATLNSAVTKIETIEKARKLKELAHEKSFKQAEFKRQQLEKLHAENILKNQLRREELVKRTLEKTSRCRTTSSSRSERSLSPHVALTPTLSLRKLTCRPTYCKPIRERLQSIQLDFYRVVRNRESELILKK